MRAFGLSSKERQVTMTIYLLHEFQRMDELLTYYNFDEHVEDDTPEGYFLDPRGIKLTVKWRDKVFYARLYDPVNNKILSDIRDDRLFGLVRRREKAILKREDYNPHIVA